jgi:hypothetical protein
MQKLKFLGGMTGAFEPTVVAAFPKNDVWKAAWNYR